MALIRTSNKADYTFKVAGGGTDRLKVVHFSGTEGISQLFSFTIELASLDNEIDFDTIVGQPALLTILSSSEKRYIWGVVSLFEQTGKKGPWGLYQAELVPSVWLLSHRYQCRIFQEKSIPDIITSVLTDGGISSDLFRFALKKTYSPRDYCVQYRESDLSFIRRLMAQHGLSFFFEHTSEKEIMVIGDAPDVHIDIAAPKTLLFRPPSTAGVSDREHIHQYSYQKRVRPGAVRLRDFAFEKPALNLEVNESAKQDTHLEIYDYPGDYQSIDEGQGLARVLLEQLQSGREIGIGQSNCSRMMPGYRFQLDHSVRPDMSGEYLLVKLSHSGSQPQILEAEAGSAGGTAYHNQFQCIPAEISFRLPEPPAPTIHGPQTAIVVGPSGEEIYVDEHGRVKVQFHWDREGKRDEKSSCWVRVAQATAGPGYGSLFIPRIGHEVIVEFLEGDPDRPIITGSVYNGSNVPPCQLPQEKVMTSIKSNSSPGGGGANEIKLNDSKGKEGLNVTAQYDMTTTVGNDRKTTVTKNDTLTVNVNRTKTISADETITVTGKKEETITGHNKLTVNGGREEIISSGEKVTITGGRTEEVTGDEKITVNGGRTETVTSGEKVNITGDTNHTITGPLTITASASITLKVGASVVKILPGSIEINSPSIKLAGGSIESAADATNKISGGEVKVNGGSITSSASGAHDITGAMVKIN